MPSTTPPEHLIFLRWNLDPLASALWHHAAKLVSDQFDTRTSWIEVDPHWDPSDPFGFDGSSSLRDSISECRVAASITGIDRTSIIQTVTKTRSLRDFCNRIVFKTLATSERSAESVFMIAWFPQADRESIKLLRELGFDLVLYDPASLKTVLTKIIQSSTSPTKIS